MADAPIWSPTRECIAASNLSHFAARYASSAATRNYSGLHRWSIEAPAEFWGAVAEFSELKFSRKPDSIVTHFDQMPGAKWFPGARLNYAENLLETGREGAALIFGNERGEREVLSYRALRAAVANVAAELRATGVSAGDRVAGILPNRPETIVAALAAASIGAVWSSCSPDFGTSALLDRLAQIKPKVLFGTGAYFYNGKNVGCLPALREVVARITSIESTIVVPYADPAPELRGLRSSMLYSDIPDRGGKPEYAQLPFDHPLYILFSSGTTGAPKCIVHGAGGTLLQHRKEHLLHTDLKPGETIFFFTTCGWMMWNWLVSTLASGVTILLYDGSPFHPNAAALWSLADDVGVNVFGTSAKYLNSLERSGYSPRAHHRLDSIRSILSTGSPLPPSSFEFVANHIGRNVQVASIAGGTDIVSCFMLGNPTLPVYAGEIQSLGLGMDVHVFDVEGQSIQASKGELVCASPFPSMPLEFLNDVDGAIYRHAYFDRYPGVWCHGDYAELTEHGGIVIHGRSDAVLNPGGVRIGTSEIYRVIDQFPEITESVAVGQEWQGDTRIVLFLILGDEFTLDADLENRIRRVLREQCSPRHVPAKVLAVNAVPRTINGKLSELAVREVIHGREVDNFSALVNPEALDEFRNRKELAS
jgi:acetoacetyl-CoA synthetase